MEEEEQQHLGVDSCVITDIPELVDGSLSKISAVTEVNKTIAIGVIIDHVKERITRIPVLTAKIKWREICMRCVETENKSGRF